jgi:hypothetical protein
VTELQKDRLKDVAVAIAILPLALAVSPILVLIYWWTCLTDCWHAHKEWHDRNEYLRKQAQREAV